MSEKGETMKKLLISLLSALILLSVYSCDQSKKTPSQDFEQNDATAEDVTFTALTLEKVTELSKKGEDLTWKDFEAYDYIETGSGLYIRIYDINDDYSLSIGGGSSLSSPMYIYLTYKKTAYQRIDIRYNDVESFTEESSRIKDGTKRFTANVVQNGEAIAPAGKSELGMTLQTGTLILSVKDYGNTDLKNDDICSISTDDLTGEIKLPRLLVGDTVMVELDPTSEITQYSFDPTVQIRKAVSIQRCSELGEPITPLESINAKNYSIDDARNDRCVYFRDFDVIFGKEYFDSFLANVKYGSAASVRLAMYFSESDLLCINDLYYNGKDFTIRETDNGKEILQTYKYLRPFITSRTETTARLIYTLTDDPNVTYDRLFKGVVSSRMGDYIPFRDVYFQNGYLTGGEFYDDSQRDKDNPKPEHLLTMTK